MLEARQRLIGGRQAIPFRAAPRPQPWPSVGDDREDPSQMVMKPKLCKKEMQTLTDIQVKNLL